MKKYKTVRGLLGNSNRWTKNCFAKDRFDNEVRVNDPKAAKFCLIGAIMHVYPVGQRSDKTEKLQKIIKKAYGETSVMQFNDSYHYNCIIKAAKLARI